MSWVLLKLCHHFSFLGFVKLAQPQESDNDSFGSSSDDDDANIANSSQSDSDYEPDEDQNIEEDDEDDNDATAHMGDATMTVTATEDTLVAAHTKKKKSTSTAKRRSSSTDESKVNGQSFSDNYFSKANAKSHTSSRTLNNLKQRLTQSEVNAILENWKQSASHEEAVHELFETHKLLFSKWMVYLNMDHTILVHGFGSKKTLLWSFHQLMLKDYVVIHINGYFPQLAIKDVLAEIWLLIFEIPICNEPLHDIVTKIENKMMSLKPKLHLFLIVHNIEDVSLRNKPAQIILSRLANIKGFHIIASLEHINGPLSMHLILIHNIK